MPLLYGVVADDLTGAVDVATCFHDGGLRAVILTEPPNEVIDDADVCVVALKSRTAPVEEAVRSTVAAGNGLLAVGARALFLKYCSTFDSTAKGNIGPAGDALLELTGQQIAVVAPGYPANGRTVYQRHLFVGNDLLSHSSMRHHPLTPMRDSNLVTLLEAQSVHRAGHVALADIRAGRTAHALADLAAAGFRYAVVDTVEDVDLDEVAAACVNDGLITGGGGLASALARRVGQRIDPTPWGAAPGPGGIIAGSCSDATRRQVATFAADGPVFTVDVARCRADAESMVEEAANWALENASDAPFLIASCVDDESLRAVHQEFGAMESAATVEQVMGHIARAVVERGVTRLLVAGGETSGAVIRSLGVTRLDVKTVLGPGLAWCLTDRGVAVALKSGNFGSDNVFRDAFDRLEKDEM